MKIETLWALRADLVRALEMVDAEIKTFDDQPAPPPAPPMMPAKKTRPRRKLDAPITLRGPTVGEFVDHLERNREPTPASLPTGWWCSDEGNPRKPFYTADWKTAEQYDKQEPGWADGRRAAIDGQQGEPKA